MAIRRRPISEINVVPYIDVMLVLLVIFMATAPLLSQGVEINLPKKPSDRLPRGDDPLIVSIRKDGVIFINIGVENLDEEGTRVTIFSLEDQVAKIINVRPDLPIYIRADEDLDYGAFIGVMTVLQQSGAERVGLLTEPPEV